MNVRGLRDNNKRQKIFNYIKGNQPCIIALQETYSNPVDNDKWEAEWGQKAFFSNGTNNSKGTCILLHKVKADIIEQKLDSEGRYVFLKGKFNGYDLNILNIYFQTSNRVQEQIALLNYITPVLEDNTDNLCILGDMNTCFDPEMDTTCGAVKANEFTRCLQETLDELNLVDTYRVLHPEAKRYTWRTKRKNQIKQSRLDYIFTPQKLLYNITECKILPGIHTDHSIVHLKMIGKQEIKNGKGYWKLNNKLLTEKQSESITTIHKFCLDRIGKHDIFNSSSKASFK